MDDLLTRQIPYSAEAEQAVLGSVLIDPEKTGDLMELLTPSDFYLETNRLIFEAISDLFTAGRTVDPVVLLDELITDREKEMIFSKNAKRILKL